MRKYRKALQNSQDFFATGCKIVEFLLNGYVLKLLFGKIFNEF